MIGLLLRPIYYTLLITYEKSNFLDRIGYVFNVLAYLMPFGFFVECFDCWFETNKHFLGFVETCIFLNILVGIAYHLKFKTFNFKEFFWRNITMILSVIVVYLCLEMLRLCAPESIVTEYFSALIQITTLMYPISKILKNVYLMTDKKHPPSFIMEKLYNFEKNGRLDDLFDPKKTSSL